ncbi:hypothetical protein [Candidatus Lokiarchaeum ossiferum]|uniref:hypothetical protein n=1 Tax=Candidatus Lokiarchaeum ossiferum TaxID=2951803 RepID=UPI00352CD560
MLIVAGSALSVALKFIHSPHNITMYQISKDLNVSASTLYTRKQEFPLESIHLEL